MKILIIGKYYQDSFATHIYETLVDMNYMTEKYEIPNLTNLITSKSIFIARLAQIIGFVEKAIESIYFFRTLKFAKLYKYVEANKYNLIIVTYDYFWPIEIDNLKSKNNTKIVMWFPDAISNLGKSFFIVSNYDAVFFKDPFIVKTLSNVIKSKVYYLPECYNPKKHSLNGETIDEKYICDLTTAGNQHSWRVAFFENLKEYNLKFWGLKQPVWMPNNFLFESYQGNPVHNFEKAKAFLGAKIVINNLHFSEIWGLNVRCFEAAGIGAFQLVDWRPGLDDLYIDGEEIISFKGIIDLKTKINYYLKNPLERKIIAERAKLRTQKDHTYERRLKQLIECVYNNIESFKIPNHI